MTKRIDAKTTAKALRAELKRRWPHVKFSVRGSRSQSVDVSWTDGPSAEEVNPVAKLYEGATFDPMIDLETYVQHWLMPDGELRIAYVESTDGSQAGLVTDAPHPDAELVSLGTRYVSCNRDVSRFSFLVNMALTMINEKCHVDEEGRFGNRWIGDLARSMVYRQHEDESMEDVFERVVLLS